MLSTAVSFTFCMWMLYEYKPLDIYVRIGNVLLILCCYVVQRVAKCAAVGTCHGVHCSSR